MTDTALSLPPSLTAADAEWFEASARAKREAVAASPDADPVWAAEQLAEAAGLGALAAALRDQGARGMPPLRFGRGGEAAPPPGALCPGVHRAVAEAVAGAPSALAADASLVRLALARDAGALPLALEAAGDAAAETGIEKMLSHQLAAAHGLAMDLMATARREAYRHSVSPRGDPAALVEAVRSATAGARLVDAFSRGALALDRLRHGGRQTVVVEHQHVTVEAGGQAVVAAGVVAAGGGSGEARGCRAGGRGSG